VDSAAAAEQLKAWLRKHGQALQSIRITNTAWLQSSIRSISDGLLSVITAAAPQITSLDLARCSTVNTDLLAPLTSLTSLAVRVDQVQAPLLSLTNLLQLNLTFTLPGPQQQQVPPGLISDIATSLTQLTSLSLALPAAAVGPSFAALRGLSSLQQLGLGEGQSLQPHQLQHLAELPVASVGVVLPSRVSAEELQQLCEWLQQQHEHHQQQLRQRQQQQQRGRGRRSRASSDGNNSSSSSSNADGAGNDSSSSSMAAGSWLSQLALSYDAAALGQHVLPEQYSCRIAACLGAYAKGLQQLSLRNFAMPPAAFSQLSLLQPGLAGLKLSYCGMGSGEVLRGLAAALPELKALIIEEHYSGNSSMGRESVVRLLVGRMPQLAALSVNGHQPKVLRGAAQSSSSSKLVC